MATRGARKPKVDRLSIERQEVIQEVWHGSSETIRLSRVKYEGNDYTFVDIRRFWRGFDDDGNEVFYPSTKGLQLKEGDFLKLIESYLVRAQEPLARTDHDIH
jgi:hypothetical protein